MKYKHPNPGHSWSALFGDRVVVRVPWAQATRIRERLKVRGLIAIVCLEPAERIATLEFKDGVTPDQVREAMCDAND
jgi:hypothetical protein